MTRTLLTLLALGLGLIGCGVEQKSTRLRAH